MSETICKCGHSINAHYRTGGKDYHCWENAGQKVSSCMCNKSPSDIAAEEYAALKARAENAETSLWQEVQNVFDLEMKLDSAKNDYEELNGLYEKLETENNAMYAALLEASELGNLANKRCKVELQRIARNEAMKAGAK